MHVEYTAVLLSKRTLVLRFILNSKLGSSLPIRNHTGLNDKSCRKKAVFFVTLGDEGGAGHRKILQAAGAKKPDRKQATTSLIF